MSSWFNEAYASLSPRGRKHIDRNLADIEVRMESVKFSPLRTGAERESPTNVREMQEEKLKVAQ